jgi:N-acetylglucosaminyl-diphospho-decaprenol L-rhamnosyltransferase
MLPFISISVVSHGQGDLVSEVLADLARFADSVTIEVILTKNIPEQLPFSVEDFPYSVKILENAFPKGFGANHNAAFRQSKGEWFCVMNPDIRLNGNPFPDLLACLANSGVGVAAPLVLGVQGGIEDSARRFPSPLKILCKAWGGCSGSDYEMTGSPVYPDWVGGMFMLFPSSVYDKAGGFDERYFLYYEDVDLCARLQLQGNLVILCPRAKVVHHARRSSHRNLRYLRWHLGSMLRFFFSTVYWRVLYRKLAARQRRQS